MKVYLSGPMTGLPDYNYPAFHAAAAELRDMGFEVDNPAEHFGGNQNLERKVYLRGDIEALLKVDAVVTLPGHHKSPGSQLECAIARALNLRIVSLSSVIVFGLGETTGCDR